MKAAWNINDKTNTVSNNLASESYRMSLEEKVRLQRAIRKADDELREARFRYYENQDAGLDAQGIIDAITAKYWVFHQRRGYRIKEFIGQY